jgi:hypothetical protein
VEGRALEKHPMGVFSEEPDCSRDSEGASLRAGAKHGAVFGVMAQIFGRIRVSRYKADRKQVVSHLIVILLTALTQYRGVICLGSRNLSRCRIYIANR